MYPLAPSPVAVHGPQAQSARPARYLANGGGFVCANDGRAVASGVARLIRGELY
jgi:hypothetical protein